MSKSTTGTVQQTVKLADKKGEVNWFSSTIVGAEDAKGSDHNIEKFTPFLYSTVKKGQVIIKAVVTHPTKQELPPNGITVNNVGKTVLIYFNFSKNEKAKKPTVYIDNTKNAVSDKLVRSYNEVTIKFSPEFSKAIAGGQAFVTCVFDDPEEGTSSTTPIGYDDQL